MQILESGSSPRLRGLRAFYPSHARLGATIGRLTGRYFARIGPDVIAIDIGASLPATRRGPVVLLERDEVSFATTATELWGIADPQHEGQMLRAEFGFLDLHLRQSSHLRLTEAVEAGPRLPSGVYPVSLPQPGTLRLVWDGPGLRIRPGLDEALTALGCAGARPLIGRPPERDWRELSERELGERLLHLYESGRYAEAVEIVRERETQTETQTQTQREAEA